MFQQGLKKIPFSVLLAAGLLHPSQVLWISLVTHQEHCDYKYISQPQTEVTTPKGWRVKFTSQAMHWQTKGKFYISVRSEGMKLNPPISFKSGCPERTLTSFLASYPNTLTPTLLHKCCPWLQQLAVLRWSIPLFSVEESKDVLAGHEALLHIPQFQVIHW